jgi:acetoin utilization deacetylase AcuC-like enzyme
VIIIHDERCTGYSQPGHPERPARIAKSAPLLRDEHPDWEWRKPTVVSEEMLLRAHSPQHLERIRAAADDFDADTPAFPGIFDHAIRSCGAAIAVAHEALRGSRAFSLMRPPGHHATQDRAMGFCYFSNIAISALEAIAKGAKRVAIWDFDAHHGNGTEAIVAPHPQIAFASIHQYPGYPGSGLQSFANVTNLPVPPMTSRAVHIREVERGLKTLLQFKPDLLLVSAGFDAYAGDPITQMTLEHEDFATFGKWLSECGVPAGVILEGGYSEQLPVLIDAFLSSWNR